MFSQDARCIYHKNPLDKVICQLRFPEILSIETTLPAAFQEAIRSEFPKYGCTKDKPAPRMVGTPGNMRMEQPPERNNYLFSSIDGVWQVNLTSNFISLTCNRYTRWEDFARKLDKPLAAFIQIYKPANFSRIGLRYINLISRQALDLAGVPYRELLGSCWIGPFAEEDVPETTVSRHTIDSDVALRGGCRVKIHAGPVMVTRGGKTEPEPKFAFDQDLYMTGNIPLTHSAGALATLHSQAYSIFRGAITDMLHDAMEPETV
ncbi:MAG: TIGR04255 family protein [Oscillospiraceae bacterium]|nr:TIGR04255 family protein [Oscillospiraceae bacterium]